VQAVKRGRVLLCDTLQYVAHMQRDQVIARLAERRDHLVGLGVRELYLFGSTARNEARPDSDIDVMVDLDEGPHGRKTLFSAFDVGAIQHALTEALGRPVDIVVRGDALKSGHRLRHVASTGLVPVFADA
jgi:uncharacterized protein